MNFFEELKRRNVFRVAGAYAVGGWVLAQAAALLEGAYALPAWTDTAVVTILLVGFPLAIALAWFFELTPQGLRLTRTVPTEESITQKTGRKLDIAILVGLAFVVVMLGVNAFTGRSSTSGGTSLGSSIAVLPFVDMSPQKDQEYFSDGVTEELLNSLAQIDGLQVAGRTSSFAFKGDNRDLREIANILDVDYILEGSIRKSGDQLRITAQLIKADGGFHAWSQTFDRQLTDVFAMQDEITRNRGGTLAFPARSSSGFRAKTQCHGRHGRLRNVPARPAKGVQRGDGACLAGIVGPSLNAWSRKRRTMHPAWPGERSSA